MRSYKEKDGLMLAAGLGLGAALIYFLNPREGRRRRTRTRRAVERTAGAAGRAARSGARELRDRGGRVAAGVGLRSAEAQSSDEVIAERVRSEIARSVSHPGSITTSVEQGNVVLAGPVIAREVERLLSRLRRVRGVRSVRSRLEAHDWAADVPGLQGVAERPRRLHARELLAREWPTGLRVAGGLALGALAIRTARSFR
jgi:hypothetical protein